MVSNLGVEVGHLKTARTNTLVRDTADYRLSSKQLKRNELPKKYGDVNLELRSLILGVPLGKA